MCISRLLISKSHAVNVMLANPLKSPILKSCYSKLWSCIEYWCGKRALQSLFYSSLCPPISQAIEMVYVCSNDLMQTSMQGHGTPHPKVESVVCVWGGPHNKLTDLFQFGSLTLDFSLLHWPRWNWSARVKYVLLRGNVSKMRVKWQEGLPSFRVSVGRPNLCWILLHLIVPHRSRGREAWPLFMKNKAKVQRNYIILLEVT